MQCGGGGNSFSPLTPFPCRRRFSRRNFSEGGSCFQISVIFAKICSSRLVQWLQSPSWRGGAQRRPLIYLNPTRFLVGKKQKSRRIFLFANIFLIFLIHWQYFFPATGGALPKHIRNFRIFALVFFAGSLLYCNCAQLLGIAFFNGRLGQPEAILVEHNRGGHLSLKTE